MLSNYIFSKIPHYVRIVHYDDMVAHVPPSISGYRHAGNEVWFKAKAHDGYYYECENVAFTKESGQCSNSLWVKNGISAHKTYLGIAVSGQCTRNQPSGTILTESTVDEWQALPPSVQDDDVSVKTLLQAT